MKRPVSGVKINAITEANHFIDWVLGEGATCPVEPEPDTAWAVLQCSDSLVWGCYAGKRWRWASDIDRAVRPPSVGTLSEARVFWPECEILLWRSKAGIFLGRVAEDEPVDRNLIAPVDEDWPFEGDQPSVAADSSFTSHVTAGGNVTVTPNGRAVRIRKYLQECPDTGVLRVALIRFVAVQN